MPGNDGRTRVRVPDDWRPHGAPLVRPDASALLHALEAHIETLKAETETLKAQLAAAEARAERQAAETAELTARHAGDLAAERAKTESETSHASIAAIVLRAIEGDRRICRAGG